MSAYDQAPGRGTDPPGWPVAVRTTLGLLAVLLVGAACGTQSAVRGNSGVTATSSPPSGAVQTVVAGQPLGLTDPGAVGLNIQSPGFACGDYSGIVGPPRAVVLATNRPTYDAGEAQQMRAFVGAYWKSYGSGQILNPYPQGQQVSPPSTLGLQWISLVSQRSVRGGGCSIAIGVTNVGSGTVEIQSLGVRLLQGARPSADPIRLIEICELLTVPPGVEECPPSLGSGPTYAPCNSTSVTLELAGGAAGTVYTEKGLVADRGCPPLTLGPRESTNLVMTLLSPTPFIYPLAVTLDTVRRSDHQTLTLTRQAATLTFAAAAQLSCYALHGASLTPVAAGADVFMVSYNGEGWCF